jgi:AraC-like DNA-binding protein
MKPHLLKISLEPEHSFSIRYDVVPYFYKQWHYHPEIELVYIIKGSGRQFIGDDIHHFKPGDMILLGSNLSHLWRNDAKFLRKNSKLQAEAIIIHFLPDCFGPSFFQIPENKAIGKLFDRAQQAVRIKNNTRDMVAERMRRLLNAKSSERIVLLLDILHIIAHSRETKPVCSSGLQFPHNPVEADRLNAIYQYILNNFTKEISLEQIARVAHMSPNSFCRYFKSRIKKTFSRFLLEMRVGHACKLLAETHYPVAEICYKSGFNNFSNFNRHFKSIAGRTPLAHRKYYQEIRSVTSIEQRPQENN